MYNYITNDLKLPITVVMSKIDKLSLSDSQKSKNHTEKTFFGARVMWISSTKKDGIDKLRLILWEELTKH
jgi:GTP-binding protein EngB required for normal cell division